MLPDLQPRPKQPTAAETRLLPRPLYSPEQVQQDRLAKRQRGERGSVPTGAADFKKQYIATPRGAARLQLLADAVGSMNEDMGPQLVQVGSTGGSKRPAGGYPGSGL